MKKFVVGTTVALVIGALAASPAAAKHRSGKVKGEVVKVEQQVRTENGGEYDRLTIRTRNGQQMQLNLGRNGACDGCFQAGDQVRARISAGAGAGESRTVRSMQVRREGEMFGYTSQSGVMTKGSGGGRAGGGNGPGSGDRMRRREHQPGGTGCVGCASGRRSGEGQGGGSGRRAGGGGGGGRGGN